MSQELRDFETHPNFFSCPLEELQALIVAVMVSQVTQDFNDLSFFFF